MRRSPSTPRRRPGWRVVLVLAALGTLLLAGCLPEAPADPPATEVVAPAPPPPPPPPTLPAAPTGTATTSLDPADAPDPFVLSVDPSYCTTPPPTTTTTTTTTSTTTSTTAPPQTPTACYFAYTTQVNIAITPGWRSSDLVHWTPINSVVDRIAPWVDYGHNWAPSVLAQPNSPDPDARFVMWYTARERSSGLQCLGVATSASPAGPFVDTRSAPAGCQQWGGGTIDASPFVDTDGTPYLVYKQESPAQLWIQRLSPDGLSLLPDTAHVLWTGGTGSDAPVVEAPTMVRANGQLYLFYSTDNWWTGNYRVGVVRCDALAGPCSRVYSTAVLASRSSMLGPGGQTPFQDTDGAWHLMFHAWTAPNVGYPSGARSLHLLPMTFNGSTISVG